MSRFARGAVRVRVPATSANLGPGFDCLGVALRIMRDGHTAFVAIDLARAPANNDQPADTEG